MSINQHLTTLKRALKSSLVRNEALILTYHSVIPAESRLFPIPHHIRENLFLEQMQYLSSSGFNCLSLEELARHLQTGKIPRHSIAITFDDGFYNNYTTAYPILKSYKIPASIFITTEFVGSDKLLWPEELAILLTISPKRSIQLDNHVLQTTSSAEKSDAYLRIAKSFAGVTSEQIRLSVENLLAQTELTRTDLYQSDLYDSLRFVAWPEIAEMKNSNLIDIGSHTMSHRRLAHLPKNEAEQEIKISKQKIEQRLKKCNAFAYPHGRTGIDFKNEHMQMAIDAGYDILLTADHAPVRKGATATNLPRISILGDHSMDHFDYLMQGGAAFGNNKLNIPNICQGILMGSIAKNKSPSAPDPRA